MAMKPLRPCRHAGCGELTREGWCPKHRPKHQRKRSQDYHGWYLLPIWTDDLRPTQLLKEPYCRACWEQDHAKTPATVADHIMPHRGDWDKFTDRANLQSLCDHHHAIKTAWEKIHYPWR